MIRWGRDFRLIPIVLLATVCLFALKVSGLVFDGGYTLAERLQGRDKAAMQVTSADTVPDYPKIVVADEQAGASFASRQAAKPWAQEMFGYNEAVKGDITGSTGAKEEAPAAAGPALPTSNKPPEKPKLEVGGASYPLEQGKINSPGERSVLESLQSRREVLDARNRELDMRESLLKAAQQRLEAKVLELKETEGRINTAMGNRDEAEVQRFKSIVLMYENMKPKDAARIFDRLEPKILVEVSTQMNPRKMSDVLALMTSEGAEKLTVELANRASAKPKSQNSDLPKIEGKPSGT